MLHFKSSIKLCYVMPTLTWKYRQRKHEQCYWSNNMWHVCPINIYVYQGCPNSLIQRASFPPLDSCTGCKSTALCTIFTIMHNFFFTCLLLLVYVSHFLQISLFVQKGFGSHMMPLCGLQAGLALWILWPWTSCCTWYQTKNASMWVKEKEIEKLSLV